MQCSVEGRSGLRIKCHKKQGGEGLPLTLVLGTTLTGLEAGVGLANDIDAPTAVDDLAIAVTLLGFLERGEDLHGC